MKETSDKFTKVLEEKEKDLEQEKKREKSNKKGKEECGDKNDNGENHDVEESTAEVKRSAKKVAKTFINRQKLRKKVDDLQPSFYLHAHKLRNNGEFLWDDGATWSNDVWSYKLRNLNKKKLRKLEKLTASSEAVGKRSD